MRAVVLLLVLTGVAHADVKDFAMNRAQGGSWLHYELTGLTVVDDGPHHVAVADLVLAGARLHGFVGTGSTIAYHIGLDLAAGGTLDRGGFAYDVALFPFGVAVRFGRSSFVTFGTGIAAMGATRSLDDAVLLPLETNLEIGAGRVRLLGRVRASYVAGAPSRHDGAPTAPFSDELEGMVGLRIGHHYEEYGYPSGNGYFAGVAYKEMLGARYLGLTIGFSIDMGTPRKGTTGRSSHNRPATTTGGAVVE